MLRGNQKAVQVVEALLQQVRLIGEGGHDRVKDVHFQCLHFRDDADNAHQLGGDHRQLLACVQALGQ